MSSAGPFSRAVRVLVDQSRKIENSVFDAHADRLQLVEAESSGLAMCTLVEGLEERDDILDVTVDKRLQFVPHHAAPVKNVFDLCPSGRRSLLCPLTVRN